MKRKFIAAGALLATAFIGQTVSAKTLEDILKEKGVLTEADYKEVTKVKPLDYQLGKGFTFTTADNKFQLSVGSQVQLRYTFLDAQRSSTLDTSKFELRRIKLGLNGYAFTKDLTYKVIYNFGSTLLEETFVNYRLIDEFQVRAGQDKVPFSRQFMTSSGANQFVDVSAATNAFAPGFDTGVNLIGKLAKGLAYYSVGGFGGVGQSTFRAARDNAFAARVAANPLGDMAYSEADLDYSKKPLVSVGSSFYRNTLNSASATAYETNRLGFATAGTGWFGVGRGLSASPIAFTESVDFNTFEGDVAFKWLGASLQGEYFWAQADGQTTKRIARGQGYYVQAGYFIIPTKLEVAARYSYLDPNRDVANDNWVETTGAVSWYINKHNLKLQADYTDIHKQSAISGGRGPVNDQQARVQLQVLL